MKEYLLKMVSVLDNKEKSVRTLLPVKQGEKLLTQIGQVKNNIKLVDCFEIK